MTEENILEKNLKAGSREWLDNSVSLLRKLLGRRLGLWVTAALFFLLPLQTRYIFREASLYEWGTLSIYAVEILGWVVIAFGFTRTLKHDNTIIMVTKRVKVLLCLSVTVVFLSIAWAPDKAVALATAVRVLEGVLLFYVLRSMSYVLRPTMVWAFIGGAVLQSMLGIFQFLTQSSFASTIFGMALHDPVAAGTAVVEFGDHLFAQAERWLRAYGGLAHPNILGGYLVIALAITVKSFFEREKDKIRLDTAALNSVMRILPIVRWAVIPILIAGIFFTFSRTGWIVAIGIMIWWWVKTIRHYERSESEVNNPVPRGNYEIFHSLRSFRMTKDRFYVLLTTSYVLFLVLLFRPLVAARIFPDVENRLEIKSRVERVAGVGESWQLIKKHPVLGVGIGNYTQAVQRELRPGQPLYTYQPVHNVPLLIWAELGTVGLFLFIGILYFLWRQSQNYLLFTTFYILLIFDHYLWSLPFGILLFFGILGLSTGYIKRTP